MTKEPGRTFDRAILSAWQGELRTIFNQNARHQCLQRECDWLSRFAVHHQDLKPYVGGRAAAYNGDGSSLWLGSRGSWHLVGRP